MGTNYNKSKPFIIDTPGRPKRYALKTLEKCPWAGGIEHNIKPCRIQHTTITRRDKAKHPEIDPTRGIPIL